MTPSVPRRPALMYHDVTAPGDEDASGFPGGDAARYKLTPELFAAHLAAIAGRTTATPIFTFDDGGVSAEAIADALERHGWRGYFFVTSGWIGRAGFLDAPRLRQLRARGHVIGSHSHTHPLRMAACPVVRLRDEWDRSVRILSHVLGEQVETASVPGGHHSPAVFETAAEAGITTLFTSEPTLRVRRTDGMRIVGRYAMRASTSAAAAAGLAAGDPLLRARWSANWMALKAFKRIAGPAYLRLRSRILGASPDVKWGDQYP